MAIVWITGAKGFIGRHLALHLYRLGHEVYGIGHGIWPQLESSQWGLSGWANGDIDSANLEAMRRSGGLPSRVFHLAGGSSVGTSIASPLEDFSRTVNTSARLLEWLRVSAPEARLVVVSSAAVYGSRYDDPIGEDFPTGPVSPYGHHKLMMEELCRSYVETFGVRCTIVRLFSVYGPELRKQLLWDLCSKLSSEAPVLRLGGSGRELRDWTEIRDVVRLLDTISVVDGDDLVLLNGGSGVATPVSSITELLVNAWGKRTKIEFVGEARPGDPFSLVARPDALANRGFNWEISLSDGIASYVRWFKSSRT